METDVVKVGMGKSFSDIQSMIDAVDTVAYERTRNHLSGAVSRLSPYISRGVITLPYVRDRILAHNPAATQSKFIQELAWRDYFQLVWQEKGDAIFTDLRFKKEDTVHGELVTGIAAGTTGIITIDTAVKELYETGYLHNHNRLFIASLACNIAKADWLSMGKWMYAHLFDGDLASNFLSWQWVAGTSVSKRYYANQSLINSWSPHKQTGTWLDVSMETLPILSCPTELHDHEPFMLTTTYPPSDRLPATIDTALLYTPWTLDPRWRSDTTDAVKILVIDPTWFDRFPVSDSVMQFIVAQGKLVIDDLFIHVGTYAELPPITTAYYKQHPTTVGWDGHADPLERLFPLVTGYYPSFFAFWKEVSAVYRLGV